MNCRSRDGSDDVSVRGSRDRTPEKTREAEDIAVSNDVDAASTPADGRQDDASLH